MFPKDWACLLPGMAALVLATGCARTIPKPDTDSTQPAAASAADREALISRLEARIESLEGRLALVNEKFETLALRQEPGPSAMVQGRASGPKPQPVVGHPADGVGAPVETPAGAGDPGAGFSQGEPIEKYRQAMVDFRAGRWAEAMLGFSKFVDRFPDHPLAGVAQFHVGETYFRRGEWALAVNEYQRVLTSYDRSSHVPDTLARMAEAEERLKRTTDATRHRQMLLSLYPQSPAAARVGRAPVTSEAEEAPAAPVDENPVLIPRGRAKPKPAAVQARVSNLDEVPPSVVSPASPVAPRVRPAAPEAPAAGHGQLDEPPPTLPVKPEE